MLQNRNSDWAWNVPIEPEAIIALQLSKHNWYSRTKCNTYITALEMNIELLSALSKFVFDVSENCYLYVYISANTE